MAKENYKFKVIKMKFIIIVFIISVTTSCSPNLKIYNTNKLTERTIEKFDIKTFESKNIQEFEIYSETINDTIVEVSESNDAYVKQTRDLNSPYVNKKTYYKENYQLKTEGDYFYKFPIGISKKYSLQGNVIEIKNWDEKYPFSVNQLIDKMKEGFDVDLTVISDIGIDRRFEIDGYYYIIIIPNQVSSNTVREIKINGSNGNVVSDKVKQLQKN